MAHCRAVTLTAEEHQNIRMALKLALNFITTEPSRFSVPDNPGDVDASARLVGSAIHRYRMALLTGINITPSTRHAWRTLIGVVDHELAVLEG